MWGKLYNSGQSCVAPDYILLTSRALRDEFVRSCKDFITQFFGKVLNVRAEEVTIVMQEDGIFFSYR